MSYSANLNSALTYFKVDRVELARESLLRAYSEVPDSDKTKSNADYLKILALLGKLSIMEAKLVKAVDFIDQGLAVKNDHIDLMFLKILYLFEMNMYDEMFAFIGLFLIAQDKPENIFNYEFCSPKALDEVYTKLLPTAYLKSNNRDEIKAILIRLKEASQSPSIQKAIKQLEKIDEKQTWQSAEKK